MTSEMRIDLNSLLQEGSNDRIGLIAVAVVCDYQAYVAKCIQPHSIKFHRPNQFDPEICCNMTFKNLQPLDKACQ